MTRAVVAIALTGLILGPNDHSALCGVPQTLAGLRKIYIDNIRAWDLTNIIGQDKLQVVLSRVVPILSTATSVSCSATSSFSYDRNKLVDNVGAVNAASLRLVQRDDVARSGVHTTDQLRAFSLVRGRYDIRYEIEILGDGRDNTVSLNHRFDYIR